MLHDQNNFFKAKKIEKQLINKILLIQFSWVQLRRTEIIGINKLLDNWYIYAELNKIAKKIFSKKEKLNS